MSPLLSFTLLDYNRPKLLLACLKSVHEFVKFSKEVIVVINGGNVHDEILKASKEGLIDRLIILAENKGCSCGTDVCYENSSCELTCFLQADQVFCQEFFLEDLEIIKEELNRPNVIGVSLAGKWNDGFYNERVSIMKKMTYLGIPHKTQCGPGNEIEGEVHREVQLARYFHERGLQFSIYPEILAQDTGIISVRQNKDNSVWAQRIDTKQVRLLKGPVIKADLWPPFSDSQWDFIILSQQCRDLVPESQRHSCFNLLPDEIDWDLNNI